MQANGIRVDPAGLREQSQDIEQRLGVIKQDIYREAGREFKKMAENTLEDGFMATPAVSGRALFLRTRTQLYRVEE